MPFAYNGNAVQTRESSKERIYTPSRSLVTLTVNNKGGTIFDSWTAFLSLKSKRDVKL